MGRSRSLTEIHASARPAEGHPYLPYPSVAPQLVGQSKKGRKKDGRRDVGDDDGQREKRHATSLCRGGTRAWLPRHAHQIKGHPGELVSISSRHLLPVYLKLRSSLFFVAHLINSHTPRQSLGRVKRSVCNPYESAFEGCTSCCRRCMAISSKSWPRRKPSTQPWLASGTR